MLNPDNLPPWLWIPAAVGLWGYLIADAIVRRHNRKKETHRWTRS